MAEIYRSKFADHYLERNENVLPWRGVEQGGTVLKLANVSLTM